MNEFLKIKSISKSFGSLRVLRSVDLTVAEGTIHVLLGPSGCGKTTLLRMIAGFEVPDSGSIQVADQVVVSETVSLPPEKRNIGFVFQDYALFPHLNVAQNVAFGLRSQSQQQKRETVETQLKLVQLQETKGKMPAQLSGGQQQRVALARALALSPKLVLFDEPFSNLDAVLRVKLRRELKQLLKVQQITAVFVTHDQEEAFSLGDTVSVVDNGQILQSGTPSDLYLRPKSRQILEFIGSSNIIEAQANDSVASSSLGELTLSQQAQGSVELAIRPEQLEFCAADEDGAVEVEILHSEFFGQQQHFHLRLKADSKTLVLTQWAYLQAPQSNHVRVNGEVWALPKN